MSILKLLGFGLIAILMFGCNDSESFDDLDDYYFPIAKNHESFYYKYTLSSVLAFGNIEMYIVGQMIDDKYFGLARYQITTDDEGSIRLLDSAVLKIRSTGIEMHEFYEFHDYPEIGLVETRFKPEFIYKWKGKTGQFSDLRMKSRARVMGKTVIGDIELKYSLKKSGELNFSFEKEFDFISIESDNRVIAKNISTKSVEDNSSVFEYKYLKNIGIYEFISRSGRIKATYTLVDILSKNEWNKLLRMHMKNKRQSYY